MFSNESGNQLGNMAGKLWIETSWNDFNIYLKFKISSFHFDWNLFIFAIKPQFIHIFLVLQHICIKIVPLDILSTTVLKFIDLSVSLITKYEVFKYQISNMNYSVLNILLPGLYLVNDVSYLIGTTVRLCISKIFLLNLYICKIGENYSVSKKSCCIHKMIWYFLTPEENYEKRANQFADFWKLVS